ncbi:MAG: flagellar motor switch protein FliN [Candidatus Hinthialibacter antarcticus]|nr:flagellar motor switch protein FliN [Candidatus Hinthialibacter antarcticus]
MLTPEEEDAIKMYQNLMADAGKDVFSTLLASDTELAPSEYSEADSSSVASQAGDDIVLSEIDYKGYIQGKSALILNLENAQKIAAQMTGGGAGDEFGDLEESALSEAVQSLYSAVNTKLASAVGGEISVETPDIITKPEDLAGSLPEGGGKHILLKYQITSGDMTGPVYQVLPRNLLQSLTNALGGSAPAPQMDGDDFMPRGASGAPEVLNQPAQFAPGMQMGGGADMFGGGGGGKMPSVDTRNLELVLDIQLEIKVELGRTVRKIRDVLELGPGSVIELNKLAGEPVDILVNDKLFAKGEVVVIDENFGVRITDILTIDERLEALK